MYVSGGESDYCGTATAAFSGEYRLLTVIHYAAGRVMILDVLTHEEYDREKWK